MPYVQVSSGLYGMMVRGIWAKDCLSAEQLRNSQIQSSSLKQWTGRLLTARRIIVILVGGFEVLSVDDGVLGGFGQRRSCRDSYRNW